MLTPVLKVPKLATIIELSSVSAIALICSLVSASVPPYTKNSFLSLSFRVNIKSCIVLPWSIKWNNTNVFPSCASHTLLINLFLGS